MRFAALQIRELRGQRCLSSADRRVDDVVQRTDPLAAATVVVDAVVAVDSHDGHVSPMSIVAKRLDGSRCHSVWR